MQTEALRPLPEETERNLHEAGLFRILQPRRIGGGELDYVAMVDVADVLARGDASVAWTVTNLASHHWMLAMFEERRRTLIWGESPDTLIASSFVFPCRPRNEGRRRLRPHGRWPFSSGVGPSQLEHACRHRRRRGRRRAGIPDFPGSRPRLSRSSRPGMRSACKGTGSHDCEIAEAFVPEA